MVIIYSKHSHHGELLIYIANCSKLHLEQYIHGSEESLVSPPCDACGKGSLRFTLHLIASLLFQSPPFVVPDLTTSIFLSIYL